MIDGRPVVGIILARGGSKRLPGKNVMPLGGKPMIAWTVEAALASETIDRVVLSSDDDAIMDAARDAGCEVPFCRPAALAGDTATSADAVLHALDELNIDDGYLVLLQPTSPLRTHPDIDGCVEKCHKSGAFTCATVSKLDCPADWLVTLDDGGRVHKAFNADSPDLYRPNGSVYVVEVKWFRKNQEFWKEGVTLAHETPAVRSVDVDTAEDFKMAQYLMSQQNQV